MFYGSRIASALRLGVIVVASVAALMTHVSVADAYEVNNCYEIAGASIYGLDFDEYRFIGSVTSKYDSNSIANSISKYDSDSIMYQYGMYGGKYSSTSAWNKSAFDPPILVNQYEEFVGYVSVNTFMSPRIDPSVALMCALNTYELTEYGHEDLIFSKDFPEELYGSWTAASCPTHAIEIDGVCYCEDGYQPDSSGSYCVAEAACPANSTLSSGGCYCNEGFEPDASGSYCAESSYCPANSTADGDLCYCDLGYEPNTEGTACVGAASCPENSTLVDDYCYCDIGYVAEGGQCVNAASSNPPPSTNAIGTDNDVSVRINAPKGGKDVVTQKESYMLRGEIGSSVAFLELNGDPVSLTPGSASWSVEIELDKGDNDLEFVAYDVARTSSDRAELTITLDTKAPGDVRDLKANGMMLTWESPKDKDVAGYRVYRQDGKKWKKVKSVTKEEFTVTSGGTYAVTAEDEAGNEADVDDAPTVSTGSSFDDVPPTHFAANAVSSLSSRGVISGNGGRFYPDNLVTRAEFAKMLAGAMGEEGSGNASFEDVPSSHSLARFIASVTSRGWASGQGRKFFPDRPITRMEAARMIVRAKGLSPSSSCQLTDIANAEERGFACALYAAGIATGQGGQFFPGRFLTRAEAAKMLASI